MIIIKLREICGVLELLLLCQFVTGVLKNHFNFDESKKGDDLV